LGFLGRIANHRKLPPRIALAGNLQYWTQQKNPWSFNDVQISQGRLSLAAEIITAHINETELSVRYPGITMFSFYSVARRI
jgi:lipopolysaccharide export system protein LptA